MTSHLLISKLFLFLWHELNNVIVNFGISFLNDFVNGSRIAQACIELEV